jgi:regulator of sigma E protease
MEYLFARIIPVILLVLGFGFVIFFHELGHFLAAKWVGIKVEQFAVGFGQAIASWRKGMGFCWGSSEPKLAKLKESGVDISGIAETEYRLNWMPLGGYVKMLGQDDMNPNSQADDPRAFNRKSIGARMLVVSAGVIMNVVLALLLFGAVFMVGLHVQPPVAGPVQSHSPAQQAGLMPGDTVRWFNNQWQHDFTKITLAVALAPKDYPVPVTYERDGKMLTGQITPLRPSSDTRSMLSIGMLPASELCGFDATPEIKQDFAKSGEPLNPAQQILPGDVITHVNGKAVGLNDYAVLDKALQESAGRPVALTVRDEHGAIRTVKAEPQFEQCFGDRPFDIAGMEPRVRIAGIQDESPVRGKLMKDDVIVAVTLGRERKETPTMEQFVKLVSNAGKTDGTIGFTVLRKGQLVNVDAVAPTAKVRDAATNRNRRGLGVGLQVDDASPVIADVIDSSAAARAQVKPGATITAIDDQPVEDWHDVLRLLRASSGTSAVTVKQPLDGQLATFKLELNDQDRQSLSELRYGNQLLLKPRSTIRRNRNPLIAMGWGFTETRDTLIQLYQSLHRVIQGSVSATNLMGPVGMVQFGSLAAQRGTDWLLWFLAMISANLAVVNFLPIPIVDGGLFAFLILEKVVGKPLSPRTQTVAQFVGLAIILGVFLLATYQDIARLFTF